MKSLDAVASKKVAAASPMERHPPITPDVFSPGLLTRKLGGGSLDYFIAQNYPAHNA
jgi:hypothetical protein